MKMTVREKIMLMVLGGVAVVALFYYFLVTPQLDKLVSLRTEQQKILQEVKRVKAEVATLDSVTKQSEEMDARIAEKTTRFLPVILQDKLTTVLNGLIQKTAVKAQSAGFAVMKVVPLEAPKEAPKQESLVNQMVDEYKKVNGQTTGEKTEQNGQQAQQSNQQAGQSNGASQKDQNSQKTQQNQNAKTAQAQAQSQQQQNLAEGLTVTIQFTASYEQLMQFVKSMEALNRTILVNNLVISKAEGNLLKGSIMIDFYALPKIQEQDQDYFRWPYNGAYGKSNPFN